MTSGSPDGWARRCCGVQACWGQGRQAFLEYAKWVSTELSRHQIPRILSIALVSITMTSNSFCVKLCFAKDLEP